MINLNSFADVTLNVKLRLVPLVLVLLSLKAVSVEDSLSRAYCFLSFVAYGDAIYIIYFIQGEP